MSSTNFFCEEVDFKLTNENLLSKWIEGLISIHEKLNGEINYIFCSDSYLLEINKSHLNHDYFTDIITFNYNQPAIVSGDVFISINRVEENAKKYSVTFENELHRVMAHGILHLIGFNDKTAEEQKEMSNQENSALKLLQKDL